MSIIVDILANIIRDNMNDAETTTEDWQLAINQVLND